MWRHDPALFACTPIRRSSETTLRSSRCFSKTTRSSARHNDEPDNNNGKRPSGMSDLEWMRQRHLRRYWRKRIEEDPYRALFSASEDMLKGRGLEGYIQRQREMHRKGLEWVERTFPKWMLEDMGLRSGQEIKSDEDAIRREESQYPKRVPIKDEHDTEAKKTEGPSREAVNRNRQFERGSWNEGIASPSDPRRPRDQPMNPFSSHNELQNDIVQGLCKDMRNQVKLMPQEKPLPEAKSDPEMAGERSAATENDAQPRVEVTAQETSFIEEFLADKAPLEPSNQQNDKEWRQTALQRRAAAATALKSRRRSKVPVVDVNVKDKARHFQEDTPEFDTSKKPTTESKPERQQDEQSARRSSAIPESTSEQVVLNFRGPLGGSRVGMQEIRDFNGKVDESTDGLQPPKAQSSARTPNGYFEEWERRRRLFGRRSAFARDPEVAVDGTKNAVPEQSTVKDVNETNTEQAEPEIPVAPRKSASEILEQLPKDDIDFLSADDIRATMGRTKRPHEDKVAVRRSLEEDYKKDTPELHPVVEAQVVNGQYVRRTMSELTQAHKGETVEPVEPESPASTGPEQLQDAKPASVLETGMDFMSRFLHTGGNVFAQHFWQDPVQLAAGQLSGADEEFFKGVGVGILKGRKAFALVKDDLIEDVPATRELINRLNMDEVKASTGSVRLYRELPHALKDTLDTAASKVAAQKRVKTLRQALFDTDRQFKEACELVDAMKNSTKPTFLLEKRMRFASTVLRKNAKLTRVAVFGLQGRIETATGSDGLVFRELLHRLLTLQDTQIALSRLVSRAIQVLGINPETPGKPIATEEQTTASALDDPTVVEALASVAAKSKTDPTAADQKLEDEISKQKAAMRGLSDDGYKYPPKPFVRKPFEGPNPLSHSLFRPFGLQIENLGKDIDADKEGVITAAKKEKGDRELVKEVKNAYEEVYGAITVDHRQAPRETEQIKFVEEPSKASEVRVTRPQASIQMLKEDEVSPSMSAPFTTKQSRTVTSGFHDVADGDPSQFAPTTKASANDALVSVRNVQPLNERDRNTAFLTKDGLSPEEAEAKVEAETGSAWDEDPRYDLIRKANSLIKDGLPPKEVDAKLGAEYGSAWNDHALTSYIKDERDALTPSAVAEKDSIQVPSPTTNPRESYKTFIYNAETDKLSITVSQVPRSKTTVAPIPLHEALATLSHPAKFIDHLPGAFHVISVRPDVLTVQIASETSVTDDMNRITTPEVKNAERIISADEAEGVRRVNPVDGTTTLSPTGFEGVGSDLERELEFQERRRRAEEYNMVRENLEATRRAEKAEKKRKGRVGFGGVVKTAIWAGAFCYVIGVLAEVAKVPL